MAQAQAKARKYARTSKQAPEAPDVRTKDAHVRTPEERAKAAAELDAVLEDIDEVLVENAQEFVQEYVQKGGE